MGIDVDKVELTENRGDPTDGLSISLRNAERKRKR